MHFNQNQLEKR